MKRVFIIEGAGGTQRLTAENFPLSIGGAGADIALGDVPESVVLAHIALSSGHAYVQAASDAVELFHNHEYVSTSAWLKSGDRLQLGDWVLGWDVRGDQVFIKLGHNTDEPQLQPPPVSPPESETETDAEIIQVATASMSPAKRRRLRYLLFTLFSVLSLAALFVLFATPVIINVSPEPDTRSVSGFPPAVSFGERKLLLPGTYTLRASREGYQSLEQDIEVSSGGLQRLDFELQELPGRLRIITDPAVGFRVSVDGGVEVEADSNNIVLLQRGTQQLSIETDRYLAELRELDIAGFGALQELNIALRPAWANVQLDSRPTGADVLVDGSRAGTTPLQTEIIQGQRRVELLLPGFKTSRFERLFVAGSVLELDTVELEPNDGVLVLGSTPSGAAVSVDGTFYGSTPVSITLTSGISHQLRLRKAGYRTGEKTVNLRPDEERQLLVELSPDFGIVFVSSHPADAALSIDGKPSGSGTQRLRLTARQHELLFSKPGYLPQTVKVTPRTDTSQNVEISLKTLEQAKAEARPALLRTTVGQEMHLLEPLGSFQMGASRREAGRRANESQRLIELTRPFYLASKEVSNAEYRLFKRNHNSGSAEGVSLNADNLPVVNVSWDDAARYCNWLSAKDKLPEAYLEKEGQMMPVPKANTGYRLASEAEWAYAARIAGRSAPARYSWGEGYPPDAGAGNFADAQIADTLASVVADYNDGYRGPAPVGSFTVQPPGFFDLGGNVAEWTNDYYAVYPGQSTRLDKDPTGPASGDHHVVRGSSWRDGSIAELRLSYRDYSRGPRDNLGFRIARYADE